MGYRRIALRRRTRRCYPLRALGAGTLAGDLGRPREEASGTASPARRMGVSSARDPALPTRMFRSRPYLSTTHRDQGHTERMDAKQVWRAALGELQVSLSPANFETWLRDTQLVDVEDKRFRIAVPNGFAKDWLETRYRSLISQTLARIVGYSVQVEFVVGPAAAGRRGRRRGGRPGRPRRGAAGQPARPPRADARRWRGRRDQPQPALHVQQLHRRLGQPPGPCGQPVGRRAPRARLQPALPVRRRGPRQDPPDARHRQPGDRPLPAQARRVRHDGEVHQRVHHEHPAGQDRRVPGALPPDRPPAHRRHPVHRGQGTDPGRVLPYVQRDPRGRQADRPVLGPAAQGHPDPRGAPAQPLRVGPHRGPDRARPRDAHRHPAGQGRGGRRPDRRPTSSSSSRARS